MTRRNRNIFRQTVHWILVAYIAVYIFTGFGITTYQTIEPLTLGLMGKATAMQLHNNMELPFVLLLAVHVYVSLIMRQGKEE